MGTRRDFLIAGLAASLAACGGGGSPAPSPPPTPAPTPVADDPPQTPTAISGDWAVDSPVNQGVPQRLVNQLAAQIGAVPNARGLAVARHGKLIGEAYYNGYGREDLQHVRSITKSVSSMMLGMALRDGLIASVDTPLSTLLPEALASVPASTFGKLRLEQILTMRSGVQFNDDTEWGNLIEANDSVRFVLGLGLTPNPGFHYDSAGSHLPSAILQRLRGLPLDQLVARDLFAPLGISRYAWTTDGLGVPYGSFGLQLRTRDTAKLAQLVLDNGRNIVPPNWIAESTGLRATPNFSVYGALSQPGYGYLWWSGTLGGKPIVLGWGFAGQFAVIVRSLDLVIQTNTFHSVDGNQKSIQETGLFAAIAAFLAAL